MRGTTHKCNLNPAGRSSRGASHWDCAPQRQPTPHKCYSYAFEFCPSVVPHLRRSGAQRLTWTIVEYWRIWSSLERRVRGRIFEEDFWVERRLEVMENLEQSGTSSLRENLRGRFLGRASSGGHGESGVVWNVEFEGESSRKVSGSNVV